MPLWTTANLPDLTGRSVIITGANSGLGFETAKALAHKGASLTLAVRDRSKGDHAAAAIGGDTTTEILDLADLDSVRLNRITLPSLSRRAPFTGGHRVLISPPNGKTI